MSYISIEEFKNKFDKSDGLCLQHFLSCIENVGNPEDIISLLDSQLFIWGDLSRELKEYIRKMNWEYSKEPKGTEQEAWIKAIRVTSGINKNKES